MWSETQPTYKVHCPDLAIEDRDRSISTSISMEAQELHLLSNVGALSDEATDKLVTEAYNYDQQ